MLSLSNPFFFFKDKQVLAPSKSNSSDLHFMRQRSPTDYAAPLGLFLSHPYSFKKVSIQGCHFLFIYQPHQRIYTSTTNSKVLSQNLLAAMSQ